MMLLYLFHAFTRDTGTNVSC